MPRLEKHPHAGLELLRLTLASLAVWLAVTCLVACNRTPVATATASAIGRTDGSPVVPAVSEQVITALPGDELAAVEDEIAANSGFSVRLPPRRPPWRLSPRCRWRQPGSFSRRTSAESFCPRSSRHRRDSKSGRSRI